MLCLAHELAIPTKVENIRRLHRMSVGSVLFVEAVCSAREHGSGLLQGE